MITSCMVPLRGTYGLYKVDSGFRLMLKWVRQTNLLAGNATAQMRSRYTDHEGEQWQK